METRIATAIASGSTEAASAALIAEIRGKLNAEPQLVMAFASTTQGLEGVLPNLKKGFPTAAVLGSSSAGEFTETRDAKGSVAVFALQGDFSVRAGMGTNLKSDPEG